MSKKHYNNGEGTEPIYGEITFEDVMEVIFPIVLAIAITAILMMILFWSIEEDKKNWPTAPANIKLHFANGEIYGAEIDYLYVPESGVGRYGGSTYDDYSGNVLHKANLNSLNEKASYRLVNSSVLLKDGKSYSFYDAYKVDYNFERNEINLYLWKENPSKTELESFKLIN